MLQILLLLMSAFLHRSAVSAFIGNVRSTSRRSRSFACRKYSHHHRMPAISSSMAYSSMQRTATSLNLLSNSFSTNDSNGKLSTSISQSKHDDPEIYQPTFKKGDLVMVEVIYFGPLGASVDVVAHNTHNPSDCISQDDPALGRGMILQREINYFRRGRGGVDIVKYEILPAYVENVREGEFEEGKIEERLDISLRPPGGKAKAQELGEQILDRLKESNNGVLNVGDKSSPEEIDAIFPGASKSAFKKAVSGLYRRGLVSPGSDSITLM
jgi:hypothetical protein